MFLHHPGHRVVGDPRQLRPLFGRGDVFERRVGQGDDLAVIAIRIHLAKPSFEIVQKGHVGQTLADIAKVRRHREHFFICGFGKYMGVDIDDHASLLF